FGSGRPGGERLRLAVRAANASLGWGDRAGREIPPGSSLPVCPARLGERTPVTSAAPPPPEDSAHHTSGQIPTVTGQTPTVTGEMPTITGSIPTITGSTPELEDAADHDLARLPSEQDLSRTRTKATAMTILVLPPLRAHR